MHIHHDRGGLARPTATSDGTIVEGRAARVHGPGDPLVYADHNEFRDEAELQKIVDGLPGLPVRLGHDGRDVGTVISARLDDGFAVARIRLTDSAAIDAIKRGVKELSIGYRVESLDAKGYQRGISMTGGELAIVDRARCGSTCAIADSVHADCGCSRADEVPALTRKIAIDYSLAWRAASTTDRDRALTDRDRLGGDK